MEVKSKYFKRTSKLPTETELALMKEKVIALSAKNKQSSTKEGEQMTTEENTVVATAKAKKPRKRLSDEQGVRMIKEWDTKTVSEWAKEFGVSYQTISNMAKVLNEKDASLCQKKNAKPKTRNDIADEWIALLKKEKGKK